jgi:pantoate--beta-alanine ligase
MFKLGRTLEGTATLQQHRPMRNSSGQAASKRSHCTLASGAFRPDNLTTLMTQRIRVMHTLAPLRQAIARYRAAGETIALVPTMGALHEGHLALIRFARKKAKRVVVSVFVNPTQFAPQEDFSTYPRTWAADLAALRRVGADLVWAPSVALMYPEGFATLISPEGPARAGLEDAFRPHFFRGVATVVAKLFLQCQPDVAVFGEKDYQQLIVVTRMVRDLAMPLRIFGVPTVREGDGLALSSRNAYLEPKERTAAPTLYRVLTKAAKQIVEGRPIARAIADGRKAIVRAGFVLDYLEARHAETLQPVHSLRDGPVRLLVAAKLGATRLIDNVAVRSAGKSSR